VAAVGGSSRLVAGFFMRGRMGGMPGIAPIHLLIVCVVVVALLWKRLPRFAWRFTTRDILIVTTLVAVILALVVWASAH
jgi:hypothetical protein